MTELIGFVFLGLFSPGPNVILLTTSGARFGFRATLPHLLGVALGCGVIAFVAGFGLALLLERYPNFRVALGLIAAGWILWMAWRLWHAQPARVSDADRPFTFIEALLFQWVNPKIWAVALSASAIVGQMSPLTKAVTLAVTFCVVNLGVCLFWTYAGSLLRALLSDPVRWRRFMRTMAVALALCAGLVLLG